MVYKIRDGIRSQVVNQNLVQSHYKADVDVSIKSQSITRTTTEVQGIDETVTRDHELDQ